MNNTIRKIRITVYVLFILVLISGCAEKGKNQDASSADKTGTNKIQNPVFGIPVSGTGNIVVSVNGKVFTKSELDEKINERMKMIQANIPANKQLEYDVSKKEIEQNLRRQIVEGFIEKTLLHEEFERKKIVATNKDISKAMEILTSKLPPDKRITDFMKENGVTNDDIIFAIKLDKLKSMVFESKGNPVQKEIVKYYNDNIDKYREKEAVHVRHILVATGQDDSDTVKAQKKEKTEKLRKQLLDGANFAELAKKNSDCPSKEFGGDMSYITRGQMDKTFEKAAFHQKKNVVGPVIKTKYGYHIIQVLDHRTEKIVPLEKVRDEIYSILGKNKRNEMFNDYMKKLQNKAKVITY